MKTRISLATLGLLLVAAASDSIAQPDKATEEQKAAWENKWSDQVGYELEYQFDSSGPDAWDSSAHPNVFVTTEGPGYGGLMSGVSLPGITIIDADTREIVANASFDVLSWGWSNVFEPHGLGVSPDGQWIYLPTGEGAIASRGDHAGRFLVINARTLKVDKVIKGIGQAHHASSFVDSNGQQRSILYGWAQPMVVLDPADDNRPVGSIAMQEAGTELYTYFPTPDGSKIVGTGRYRDFDMRKHLTDNPLLIIDTQEWNVTEFLKVPDSAPVWVAFTEDSKNAYVSGARGSIVMHIDMEKAKFVTEQRAGVDGPYGIVLGWDERYVYSIGKGEESHNRGKVLGLMDTTTMLTPNSRAVDQFYTGCLRGDHGSLHPDPDANEIWISCNSSFEVVVFDLDLLEVSARIPMPNGGSTHSGAFVHYPDGWGSVGEVVSDHNGLQGSALETKRALLSGEMGNVANTVPSYIGSSEFDEGRRVFLEIAGVGCRGCHGDFAEGDLGVGPYLRGATEGTIRAAIDGVVEMAAVKAFITEEEIQAVSSYINNLGSMQTAKTISKRGRFLPEISEVRPGTPMQVVVRNTGVAEATYASNDMGIEPITIPGRGTASFEWMAPSEEGEFSIYCTDCLLTDETFTIRVDADAPASQATSFISTLDTDNAM